MSFSPSTSVAVLEFGDGKLNSLGGKTRQAIHHQLQEWMTNPSISSVVLMGRGGEQFCAGADMTEFSNPTPGVLSVTDLIDFIEAYPKPVVAAIQGVALGGGLELALSCNYRIAVPSAKLGLPEVQVGVIPGAGGTQRLPRLVGIEQAINIIVNGKQVSGTEAHELGLVDGLVPTKEQSLVDCATQWASWALLTPLPRVCDIPLDQKQVKSACDAANSKLPSPEFGGFCAHAALQAIRASHNFEAGCRLEQELFWETVVHPQGRARRHAFFAVRAAQKGRPIRNQGHPLLSAPNVVVGVVGAGLMGSGIALVLLQAGFTVRLVDIDAKALQKGIQFLHGTVVSYVNRGLLSKIKAQALQKRMKQSTDMKDLKDCTVVVEAVVENLSVKKKVFSTLNGVTPPDALLLSNTSTLSIDAIASALAPERRKLCAGWHFFSPAHKMKLVEIVVGKDSSDQTIAILQSLTKRIGKIGVTVGNCFGFVGNRMLQPYTGEAAHIVAEGVATVEQVDYAMAKILGMALGPFQMGDLAGNDIGYYIRKEQGLTRDPETLQVGPYRRNRRYTELGDDLVTKLGRYGQKVGKGWYDYDKNVGKGRQGIPSKEVADFIKRYRTVCKPALDADGIIERILFPLVNEGFKILEEGMAQRPSDIDIIYLYGYGWPVWRGGPMFWADHEIGLANVLQKLQEFYREYPGSEYFRPSQLLEICVKLDVTVEEYYKRNKIHSKI
jgi:3-hydroxyacyl-CoA dehydrogenase/enoyl-CoA hydratase/carnithine racemase